MIASLREPGRTALPEGHEGQRYTHSSAPASARPGRWVARAPLPLPRSEMAWATVCRGRMHVIGGYGEQQVNRNYHHVYDPAADR